MDRVVDRARALRFGRWRIDAMRRNVLAPVARWGLQECRIGRVVWLSLALCATGVVTGCLREASNLCGNGSVCPPGLQCADTGDARICILASCGNGRRDTGEDCDDGNNRSGDGCPADCTASCGDGVRDPGEACDDGNTADGDGCSGDCRSLDGIFLVSPPRVDFTAIEAGDAPVPIVVTVRLQYRGDAVIVGYAPGVVQPPWLSIASGPVTDETAEFTLQASGMSAAGDQSTSLRFTIRHLNSTGLEIYDLPIAYHVETSDLAVQAMPSSLRFAATTNGALPPSQPASVTFNGAGIAVTSAPSWLTVTPPPSPVTSPAGYSVAVTSTALSAGTTLSGDIVFRTARGALQRSTALRVDYHIIAIEVRFVAPYLGIAGRAGTLHVRGRGFQAPGGPVTVHLGAMTLGPVAPDSDTQITLGYPALPEGRYPVTVPPGLAPTGAELVIVAPPRFTYQAISAPGSRVRLVYDAERQVIYGVNPTDQQIEPFAYAGGTWSALAPRVFPQLTDLAMAPDGQSLIMLDEDFIREISLRDGSFTPVPRVGNPDPFCGGYFAKLAAADDGHFLVVFDLAECSGFTPLYRYDMVSHGLSTVSSLYNGLVGASADGSRIYAGSNGISPAQTVGIFDALSGTMQSSTAAFNLHAVSVSGNASRVILQNTRVYGRSLLLTGNLPPRGVALASRDGSRAFVYAQDAPGPRLEVYDLNGPLQSGALYPLLATVMLPDSPNTASGFPPPVAMATSLDDTAVFVSGNSKLLVVPVPAN